MGITVLLFVTVLIDNPAKQRWLDQLNHAIRLSEQNRNDDAATAFSSALERAEDAGVGEAALAVTLGQAAAHHHQVGRLLDAERCYSQALELLERATDEDRHATVQTAIGLAGVYLQTRQISRAESLLAEVLEKRTGLAAADLADLEANLASVLVEQRRFDEAEPMFRRCISVFEMERGEEFLRRTATALSNLGGVYMHTNRLAGAGEAFGRAIQILRHMRSAPAELSAKTVGNAALLASLQGKNTEADALFSTAIDSCKRSLGAEHHLVGQLLTGYAQHLRQNGRKSEAKKAEKRATAILEKFSRENLTGHTVDLHVLRHESQSGGGF